MRNADRESTDSDLRAAKWASVVAIRLIWAIFGAVVALGMVGFRSFRSLGALNHLGWTAAVGGLVFALWGPKIMRCCLHLDHHDRPY
jgi:hypothetical protein